LRRRRERPSNKQRRRAISRGAGTHERILPRYIQTLLVIATAIAKVMQAMKIGNVVVSLSMTRTPLAAQTPV
jgi:hypothetical protein